MEHVATYIHRVTGGSKVMEHVATYIHRVTGGSKVMEHVATSIHRLIDFIRSVSVDDVRIFTCGGCVEPVRMTAGL